MNEQRVIQFNGDEIVAVKGDDGVVYVPLRPIVERLGLSWPVSVTVCAVMLS